MPRSAKTAEPASVADRRSFASPMPTLLKSLLKRIESRALILVIGAAGGFWAFFNIASHLRRSLSESCDSIQM